MTNKATQSQQALHYLVVSGLKVWAGIRAPKLAALAKNL